jgi:hypothetical protein
VLGDHRFAFAQRPVEEQFGDQQAVGGAQYGPAEAAVPQRPDLRQYPVVLVQVHDHHPAIRAVRLGA